MWYFGIFSFNIQWCALSSSWFSSWIFLRAVFFSLKNTCACNIRSIISWCSVLCSAVIRDRDQFRRCWGYHTSQCKSVLKLVIENTYKKNIFIRGTMVLTNPGGFGFIWKIMKNCIYCHNIFNFEDLFS